MENDQKTGTEKVRLIDLFLQFFKFGIFTFGGGWSIVAQIQQTYVDEKHLISSQDLLDITSIGRSLPGTMIGNAAMMFGYHLAGVAGGFACVFGLVLPAFLVIIALTFFYNAFRDSEVVAAAMAGVRSAVVPIVICVLLRLLKGAFKYKICYVMAAVAFILYLFFHVSCALLVCFGILAGICVGKMKEKVPEK